MTDPSSLYHATRLAGNHARAHGGDGDQMKFVSGLVMAFMGCKMAMDAFNRMQDKAGKPRMDGRGR